MTLSSPVQEQRLAERMVGRYTTNIAFLQKHATNLAFLQRHAATFSFLQRYEATFASLQRHAATFFHPCVSANKACCHLCVSTNKACRHLCVFAKACCHLCGTTLLHYCNAAFNENHSTQTKSQHQHHTTTPCYTGNYVKPPSTIMHVKDFHHTTLAFAVRYLNTQKYVVHAHLCCLNHVPPLCSLSSQVWPQLA